MAYFVEQDDNDMTRKNQPFLPISPPPALPTHLQAFDGVLLRLWLCCLLAGLVGLGLITELLRELLLLLLLLLLNVCIYALIDALHGH
jgi:hypothetical protein